MTITQTNILASTCGIVLCCVFLSQAVAEVRALQAVGNHPRIVPLLSFVHLSVDSCLVFPFIEGGSLYKVLEKRGQVRQWMSPFIFIYKWKD